MKVPGPAKIPIGFLSFLLICLLTACNMPVSGYSATHFDATLAYQTVQVRMTQAAAQTPIELLSETLTINPTADPDPTSTPTPNSTTNPSEPTATANPTQICNQAGAGYPKIDVTIEDDTEVAPGEAFTKIWRLENIGTCTWTIDYAVVFFSGEKMGAEASLPLDDPVSSHQSIDIAVNMVAPNDPGTYQGNWKLRTGNGALFGIGPGGESPFWIRIKVVSADAETPTTTPTLTPTTGVQASGSAVLGVTDTLDLDSLLINAGGPDLRYSIAEQDKQLVPLKAVAMIVFGSTQPSLTDCQAARLAGTPIILNELPEGNYLCYRTDLGLPGWLRFEGFEPDTEEINLQVLTWKLP